MFSLRLSPEWSLAPGVGRPEVVATHERRDRKWVVTGDAWYVVAHTEHRWALELAAHIRPIPKDRREGAEEVITINQHPGYVSRKYRRRGLPWNRHTVTFVTVVFSCPYSERQIELELSGWCPEEGFQDILRALKHIGCH